MYLPFALSALLACVPPDEKPEPTPEPEPLVLTDEWPDYTPAGDAVYIRYDDVPNMVRATPAGVAALDLGARVPLWAEATPDGRFLLVLTESDAGVEHVLVEDGAVVLAFADQETNHITASPDGRHLALWYDSTIDAHTNLLVDVTQITLVDTEAGTATRVDTGLAPRTVSLTDTTGLVVGPTGALALDLATQTAGEAYDFEAEGIGSGAWGCWGVISPDEAYAFVSADVDEGDDTVARLGLRTRSVLTAQSPSPVYDGWRDERASQLFRVGGELFAYTDITGLWSLDPDTFAFSALDEDLRFSRMEVQADRAILYVDDGTWLLWTDPEVALHRENVTGEVNQVWFGDEHAVLSRYEGGTWHAKVLELATGATWMQPLQGVAEWAALMTVGGEPVALLQIDEVDTFALLPLADGSALLPTTAASAGRWGAMANDEAFWVAGNDEAGRVAFVDPVTLDETVYRDFTDLDLLRDP